MVADANRRGYRHLLDAFWDEARSHGLALPTEHPISGASFCNARAKITSELLRHMIQELAASSAGEPAFAAAPLWYGRRVFAVDGTKINLQRSEDLASAFGVPEGGYCPQILVSTLLDVGARAPVDVEVSPFATSEREHLLKLLPRLQPGDVLVLDRGYPSHEILQALVRAQVHFLVRVPAAETFAAIDGLRASPGDDYLYWVEPPPGSPPHWHPLALRAVRLYRPGEEPSYFLTSLRRGEASPKELRDLYHRRWQAEEFFKLLKGPYIGQGQFRSLSPSGVRQEIHALILFLLIARLLMATAATATGADYTSLSQKAAVLGLAAYLTRLLLAPDRDFALRELLALLQRVLRPRDPQRPPRSCPRVSFRPRPRWGPTGNRRG